MADGPELPGAGRPRGGLFPVGPTGTAPGPPVNGPVDPDTYWESDPRPDTEGWGYGPSGPDDGYEYEEEGWEEEDHHHLDVTASRRRRGLHRHPVLAAFLGIALIVILLAGAGVLWAAHQIYPSGHLGPKVLVTIPVGASTDQIGDDLAHAGIIHSGGLFRYYQKVEGGGGPLLPGTYLLAKNESYDQVITTLQAGPVVLTDKLVIPEGFTLRQIAARVAKLPGTHLSAATFVGLSTSGSVRSSLEPAEIDDLEGLLYPATYSLMRTDNESTILEEMVGDFSQQMQVLGLAAGAARVHMTPYQVLIVASIIQGEAKFKSQFPDVASVLYNRLHAKIALGTDSTLIYALRRSNPNLNVAKVNLEQPSPYNTRLHKGLPPTPIDSPSMAAIAAAINPPHTNLKYFLAINSSGNLSFASTAAGFNKLVAQCRANHNC